MIVLLAASQRSRTESLRRTRDALAATVQELKTVNEALHTENAERKRAEGALRQSETHLAEAQRLSKTGSWVWNVKTRENVFWSREHYRILGSIPTRTAGNTRSRENGFIRLTCVPLMRTLIEPSRNKVILRCTIGSFFPAVR